MIVFKYSDFWSSYPSLEILYICTSENTLILITVCISSLTAAGLEVRRYSVTQSDNKVILFGMHQKNQKYT